MEATWQKLIFGRKLGLDIILGKYFFCWIGDWCRLNTISSIKSWFNSWVLLWNISYVQLQSLLQILLRNLIIYRPVAVIPLDLEGKTNKNKCLVSHFFKFLEFFALFPPHISHEERRGKFPHVEENAHKPAVVLIFLSL